MEAKRMIIMRHGDYGADGRLHPQAYPEVESTAKHIINFMGLESLKSDRAALLTSGEDRAQDTAEVIARLSGLTAITLTSLDIGNRDHKKASGVQILEEMTPYIDLARLIIVTHDSQAQTVAKALLPPLKIHLMSGLELAWAYAFDEQQNLTMLTPQAIFPQQKPF
jgi:phosphohistidine phosphatase SixA